MIYSNFKPAWLLDIIELSKLQFLTEEIAQTAQTTTLIGWKVKMVSTLLGSFLNKPGGKFTVYQKQDNGQIQTCLFRFAWFEARKPIR